MEKKGWRQRIGSVLVLVIFVTALSCFAGGKLRREAAEKEGNFSAAGNLKESEPQTKEGGTESAAGDAESAEKDSESKEGVPVFGRGMECEESLAEEVVTAMKNGDTESLVGAAFGEEFDYGVYEDAGTYDGIGRYGRKDQAYNPYLDYYFEGRGHRFSGFSISNGKEPFLGIHRGETPASIFVKAFGEPDHCEASDDDWENAALRADWYFDKAVLTVKEWDGCVDAIEYKALGDAADGGDDSEKPSDFELRLENKSPYEKVEAVYGGVSEEEDLYHSFWISDYEDVEKETEELIERYLREQGFAGCGADSILVERDGQVKRVCCYTDSEKRKLCFVVVQKNSDTYWIYGAVRDFQEPHDGGYLVYECDKAGNVTRETEYDVWGKRRAEACYQYHDGIPLPFLTGGWNTDDWHRLSRDKKAWFPEEGVKLDDSDILSGQTIGGITVDN